MHDALQCRYMSCMDARACVFWFPGLARSSYKFCFECLTVGNVWCGPLPTAHLQDVTGHWVRVGSISWVQRAPEKFTSSRLFPRVSWWPFARKGTAPEACPGLAAASEDRDAEWSKLRRADHDDDEDDDDEEEEDEEVDDDDDEEEDL